MFTIGQPQMLTIELICQHPPHKCRCRHNTKTEINREDLTSELINIEFNPALLKYFGKRSQGQTENRGIEVKVIGAEQRGVQKEQKYRSIVEEKGLPFCLDGQYEREREGKHKIIEKEELKESPIKKEDIKPPAIQIYQNIEPEKQKIDHRPQKESDRHKQIKKFHKDMRNQSRYLSDTAFRKYFNRQCFQNYGRNNTTGKADGIVYGNYMKTFNINPHTGQNMPLNEETFYHALVSGSPEKYGIYTQQVKLGMTHDLSAEKNKNQIEKDHFLSKDKLDVEKMLTDNEKHGKVQRKYENIHLKKNQSPKNTHSQKDFKSPSQLGIVTKKQFNNEPVRLSNARSSDALKIHQSSGGEILKPNTQSYYVPEKDTSNIKEHQVNKNSYLNVHEKGHQKNASIIDHLTEFKNISSPKALLCDHKESQQNIECACCLNKMKKMILELTEKDPDLADRIITSAKKNVLYKNYSLNNYQNAAMNPHNYRRDDGHLNIYQG